MYQDDLACTTLHDGMRLTAIPPDSNNSVLVALASGNPFACFRVDLNRDPPPELAPCLCLILRKKLDGLPRIFHHQRRPQFYASSRSEARASNPFLPLSGSVAASTRSSRSNIKRGQVLRV